MKKGLVLTLMTVSLFATLATPAAAAKCATATGPPVTKAEYESRFRAATRKAAKTEATLGRQITQARSSSRLASLLERVRKLYRRTCVTLGEISPPTEIAILHGKVVVALGGLTKSTAQARNAVRHRNRRGFRRAAGGARHYSKRLDRLIGEISGLGYAVG